MIADVLRRLMVTLTVVLLIAAALFAGLAFWLLGGDGVRVALEQQGSARLGTTVRIGSARAQFYPRLGVRLADVTIGDPARISLKSVAVSTGLRGLISRRMENAEIAIADSRLELPLAVPLLEGRSGAASVERDAPAGAALTIVSIRSISLRNVVFASGGREVTVSADSSLTNDVLTVSALSIAAAGTTMTATGSIRLTPALEADITAEADRLDLDDLVALSSAFAPERRPDDRTPPGSVPAGRATIRVSAEQATAGALAVQKLTTVVRVIGNRLSLSPTRFLLFGGRYDGDIDLNLRDETDVQIASRLTALDVAQLAAFGGADGAMTGRLSANTTVTGSGRDFSSILSSARGTGNVTIIDGTVRRLDLVRTVVVFFGRPATDSPRATDAFSRIDARISLGRGVARAEAFSMRSPDADIAGSGSLTLASQALEGAVDLSLSEALSKEAGTDLARYTREGNRIVLPARLGGTLGDPRITIDAASALKRGLRNELDRRMRGLLDRFGQR